MLYLELWGRCSSSESDSDDSSGEEGAEGKDMFAAEDAGKDAGKAAGKDTGESYDAGSPNAQATGKADGGVSPSLPCCLRVAWTVQMPCVSDTG